MNDLDDDGEMVEIDITPPNWAECCGDIEFKDAMQKYEAWVSFCLMPVEGHA